MTALKKYWMKKIHLKAVPLSFSAADYVNKCIKATVGGI